MAYKSPLFTAISPISFRDLPFNLMSRPFFIFTVFVMLEQFNVNLAKHLFNPITTFSFCCFQFNNKIFDQINKFKSISMTFLKKNFFLLIFLFFCIASKALTISPDSIYWDNVASVNFYHSGS